MPRRISARNQWQSWRWLMRPFLGHGGAAGGTGCRAGCSGRRCRGHTCESGSIETLKELVRRQSGYTLVPRLAVLGEADSNPLLKRFVAPAPVREASVVVHHGFMHATLFAALRDLILPSAPARLYAGKAGEKVRWR